MEPIPVVKKESTLSKTLKLLLKIVVTILCFWYISTKIDFNKAFDAFLNANWIFLFLAVLSFLFSKLLAAFRLNINFRNINLNLPQWRNIKLYWLGMFYNLFLPGAISGDAYKVILLNRRYKVSLKKTTSAVLLDRFSGLLALGIILSIYGMLVLEDRLIDAALAICALLAITVSYLFVRYVLKEFLPGFFPTFFGALQFKHFR